MEIKEIQNVVAEAKDAFQHGKYAQAAEGFATALKSYQTLNDDLMAAETANNLSVALLQAGEPEAALEAVGSTEETFNQAGDVSKQAIAIGNRASALEALKRLDEAEAEYQRCADLLEAAGESEMRVHVMKSLAALQIRRGKQVDALISMQAGLRGKKNRSLKERLLSKLLEFPFKLGPK